MRILLVTERFPPQHGGVGVSAFRHAVGLSPHVERLDVVHLTSHQPAGVVEEAAGEGYRVFTVGRAPKEDESLQLLESVIRTLHSRFNHQVVHGFYAAPAGAVAVLAARSLRVPSVVSVRGNDVDRGVFQGGRAPLLLWALRKADRVLAVSRALADRVQLLTDRDDVAFTPNAVDTALFHPEPKDPRVMGHLKGGAIVGFCGEMRLKKGMAPLLEALESLPDVELLLIGGIRKDERHAFEHWQSQAPSASARIHEVPYERDRGHLRALYNAADLMVFPSLWEGMPNGLLEAMACGRPVLATAVGGSVDVVEDGANGWLLPLDRLGDLATRIGDILAMSPEARSAIGEAARKHVQTHHQPLQEIERVLDVYRALVK